MGFRRRKVAVSRSPYLPHDKRFRRCPKKPLLTEFDMDGPTQHWSVLLDSGATFPCLFEGDFEHLGIDRFAYAAQSARNIATADDSKIMRTYELDITVASESDHSINLTPYGMIPIPVVALPGSAPGNVSDPSTAPDRLSGIIPFHICFVSSAPHNFKIWLGTDRKSVLGAGRFPSNAALRNGFNAMYNKFENIPPPREDPVLETDSLGTPIRVVFEHKLADVVLRDTEEVGRESLVVSSPQVGVVYSKGKEPLR